MRSEPTPRVPKFLWAIDERKCLNNNEIQTLRAACNRARLHGVRHGKFTRIERETLMFHILLYTSSSAGAILANTFSYHSLYS
ncbi:MAG: hypothetical protein Q8O92_01805 [Candidatus Latescibacter sp.]|nr:hypothetical protein [Candidatus Latescibacter sp.]